MSFKFGDVVYHKEKGKGVYLGASRDVVKGCSHVSECWHEVIFEGRYDSDTVNPRELSGEKPQIGFVDSVYCEFEFVPNKLDGADMVSVFEQGENRLEILTKDIDKFIECLQQFKDRYVYD